jgi:hypothetical protein
MHHHSTFTNLFQSLSSRWRRCDQPGNDESLRWTAATIGAGKFSGDRRGGGSGGGAVLWRERCELSDLRISFFSHSHNRNLATRSIIIFQPHFPTHHMKR